MMGKGEPASAAETDDRASAKVILDQTVTIERVHISGLKRTKADYIMDDVKPVFLTKSFVEAYQQSVLARNKLMSKGIFRDVDVLIDTTKAYEDHKEDGIQVLFEVKEKSNLCGEVKTEMSNQEKPRWVVRLVSPNVFGRGETLSTSLCHTLYDAANMQLYEPNDFNTTFRKPFLNSVVQDISASLYQEKKECPWASYKDCSRGLSATMDFQLMKLKHQIGVYSRWRELSSMNGSSFDVRKQSGHSLKNSILHSVSYSTMDKAILPKQGIIAKLTEEFAGIGGDVGFLKEQIECKYVTTLADKITIEAAFNAGGMVALTGHKANLNIDDKFFIGGPMNLRGFQLNRIGNREGPDYLGSTAYWVAGLHAYTPLPFSWKWSEGTWRDDVKMHFFANAGNCFDFNYSRKMRGVWEDATTNVRVSCGVGIVYRFMNSARFELNFCYPLRYQPKDMRSDRLQFGIGISSV